jgi:hypothetical protein
MSLVRKCSKCGPKSTRTRIRVPRPAGKETKSYPFRRTTDISECGDLSSSRHCGTAPRSPGGTIENSPAIHRWATDHVERVPQGRKNIIWLVGRVRGQVFCRPGGTLPTTTAYPAMNRWAIFFRPPGWTTAQTSRRKNSSSLPLSFLQENASEVE